MPNNFPFKFSALVALVALVAMCVSCSSEIDRSKLTVDTAAPEEQSADSAKESENDAPKQAGEEKSSDTEEVEDDGIMGLTYKGQTNISYCFNSYVTDAETRSIAEIFTGDEYTQGYLTLRTQPDKRAGRYFSFMISGPDEIPFGSTITLDIDCSKTAKPLKFTFTVPETHNLLREVKLGVTGSDWPNPEALVNAWKITIKNPYGKVVSEKESWLWSIKGKEISKEELAEDLALRRQIEEAKAREQADKTAAAQAEKSDAKSDAKSKTPAPESK